MARLLITQPLLPDALAAVDTSGVDVEHRTDPIPLPHDELTARAADVDGLVTLLTDRVDAVLLEANAHLRVVSNVAVGFDNIDVEAATRLGIAVTHTPDVLTDATADLTWALLLAAARRVVEADAYTRAGRYERWVIEQEHLGIDVTAQTLGIYGMGKIGHAVARRGAHGFGMDVIYCDVNPLPAEDEEALGARRVAFDELLERSDFLSLHAPLLPSTRHAIDADALRRMKPTAILVNSARGPLIDEHALVDALHAGEIRGAALDVYEREPELAAGLAELRSSVVLLPHLGSATEHTRHQMCEMAVRDAVAVLRGEQPAHLVNRDVDLSHA